MRFVQPSTSALPAVAATTASRKSASLPTVTVRSTSSEARLAASSTASRLPGLSIRRRRGLSPARAEERGASWAGTGKPKGSTLAAGTPWAIITSAVAWLGVTNQSECARCQARFTETESVTTVISRGRAGSSRRQRRAIM